jgi:hypothetical protein
MSQTSPEVQLKEALAALSELKTLAEGFKSKAEVVASADERISKVETAVEEIKTLATSMAAQVDALAKGSVQMDTNAPAKGIDGTQAAEANTLEGVNKTIVKSKKKDAVAAEAEEEEDEDMEEEEAKSKKSKKAKKAAEAEEEDEEEEDESKAKKAKKAAEAEEDEDEDEDEEDMKSKKSKKAGDIPPQFLKNIKKKKEEMDEEKLEKKTKGAEEDEEEEDEDEAKSKKSKKASETEEAPVAEEVAPVAVPEESPAPVAQEAAVSHSNEIAELKAKFEAELKARDEALASMGKMKSDFESLLDRINAYENSKKSAEEQVAKAVAQMGAEPVSDAPVAEDDKPKSAEDIIKEWQSIKDAKESRAFYLKHEETIRSAAFGKVKKNA